MGQYHHSTDGPGQKNLLVAVVLNLVITVTEYAGGIISGSLALVSDATHNLSDIFQSHRFPSILRSGMYRGTGVMPRGDILRFLP